MRKDQRLSMTLTSVLFVTQFVFPGQQGGRGQMGVDRILMWEPTTMKFFQYHRGAVDSSFTLVVWTHGWGNEIPALSAGENRFNHHLHSPLWLKSYTRKTSLTLINGFCKFLLVGRNSWGEGFPESLGMNQDPGDVIYNICPVAHTLIFFLLESWRCLSIYIPQSLQCVSSHIFFWMPPYISNTCLILKVLLWVCANYRVDCSFDFCYRCTPAYLQKRCHATFEHLFWD